MEKILHYRTQLGYVHVANYILKKINILIIPI